MRLLLRLRQSLRLSKLTTTLIVCDLFLLPVLLYSESEHGHNNKRSVTELRSLVDQLNSARLTDALQYIRTLNASHSQSFYKKTNRAQPKLDLVVSIPTVSRSGHSKLGYLTQTAVMFDRLLKKDNHFGGKMMFICNTDQTPNAHWDAAILKDYLPYTQLFGSSTSEGVPLLENVSNYRKGHANKYAQETSDYMFCLETALRYKSKYILMAEDDALPREELLTTLYYLLRKQEGLSSSEETRKRRPFFLIKLYYPERWLGYANEFPRIVELVGIVAFGWGLFALLFSFCWRRTYCETVIVATLGGACFLLLSLLLGRQKIMELRRISSHLYLVRTAPDCCTPAILYRTGSVNKLINYLSQGTYDSTRPLDIAIAEYSRASNQSSLYMEPNLFRHIGMYSSLGKGPKDPSYFLFH